MVLIYLPLVVMGVYLLVMLCKDVAKYGKGQRITNFFIPERAYKLRGLVDFVSAQVEDLDSNVEELPYRLVDDNMSEFETERNQECKVKTTPRHIDAKTKFKHI